MSSILGVPMIDGIKMGIKINDRQYRNVLKALARYDGKHCEQITVGGKTKAQVLVNEFQGTYWLNIHCNPISFVTGQNVMGTTDAASIVDIWEAMHEHVLHDCGAHLLDDEMRVRIQAQEINVYQIAFASYTKKIPMEYQQHLLGFVYGLYVRPLDTVGEYKSADRILGLQVAQGESGYSLTFTKKVGNNKRWRLCIYNKAVELEDTEKEVPIEGLRDCLRVDLTLTSQWIRDYTRSHPNKGMLTALGDLRKLSMTQLAVALDNTHFATLATPLAAVANESWFISWGNWGSQELSDRQCRAARAAGYRPELGKAFYLAIEDIRLHTRSHIRQVYDAQAWARYVQVFVSKMSPIKRTMGFYDGREVQIQAKVR